MRGVMNFAPKIIRQLLFCNSWSLRADYSSKNKVMKYFPNFRMEKDGMEKNKTQKTREKVEKFPKGEND